MPHVLPALKNFRRIFKYVIPYRKYAVRNILFNLGAIVFGLFSITLVIPFLDILFNNNNLVLVKPEVKLNPMDLVNLFKYYLSKLILNPDQGKLYALGFVCLLIVGCIVLKNLFRYLALYSINPLRNFVVRDLRQSLYNKILHLPLSCFSD